VTVITGYCAVRVDRYWVGVIEGNRWCHKRRRTAKRALADAAALFEKAIRQAQEAA
jgi:hypothetical protein